MDILNNKNYKPLHKPKYKKCGIEYDIGIGILTKNPDDVTKPDLMYHKPVRWIWFEGYWYMVKHTDGSIKEKVETNTYCKEHVIENILQLI